MPYDVYKDYIVRYMVRRQTNPFNADLSQLESKTGYRLYLILADENSIAKQGLILRTPSILIYGDPLGSYGKRPLLLLLPLHPTRVRIIQVLTSSVFQPLL